MVGEGGATGSGVGAARDGVQVMRADMVLVEEEMLVELVVEQQETQMLGVQVKVEMKVGKEGVLEE